MWSSTGKGKGGEKAREHQLPQNNWKEKEKPWLRQNFVYYCTVHTRKLIKNIFMCIRSVVLPYFLVSVTDIATCSENYIVMGCQWFWNKRLHQVSNGLMFPFHAHESQTKAKSLPPFLTKSERLRIYDRKLRKTGPKCWQLTNFFRYSKENRERIFRKCIILGLLMPKTVVHTVSIAHTLANSYPGGV